MSGKKETWSKEVKERHARRLLEKIRVGSKYDPNENVKNNLNKIKDDFPRY